MFVINAVYFALIEHPRVNGDGLAWLDRRFSLAQLEAGLRDVFRIIPETSGVGSVSRSASEA